MKNRLKHLVCLIALGPIVPLYMLREAAQSLVNLIDWAVEDRSWTKPFLRASDYLERRMTARKP